LPTHTWPGIGASKGTPLKPANSVIKGGTEVRNLIILDSVDIAEIHIALSGVFHMKGARPLFRGHS